MTRSRIGLGIWLAFAAFARVAEAQECVAPGSFAGVIGRMPLTSAARVLAAQGDLVFIDHANGLEVIDVSDPRAPARVGRLESPCCFQELVLAGAYGYGSKGVPEIAILDMSEPRTPSVASSLPHPTRVSALAASMDHLFVASDSGLTVYDITNPVDPQRVGGLESPALREVGDVVVDGPLAYVLGRMSSTSPASRELLVFDVSDPRDLRLRSSLELVLPVALGVHGNHVSVVTQIGLLHVVDLTDLDAPRIVGEVDDLVAFRGITIDGDRAYVYDNIALTRVVDLRVPTAPRVAGLLESRGPVVVNGQHALMIHDSFCRGRDWREFTVVDGSKPLAPGRIGSHEIAGRDVALDDRGYAYIGTRSGFEVLDVSNPASPRRVSVVTTTPAWDIAFHRDYVYFTSGEDGVTVYDVVRPEAPREVAKIDTPHWAASVALQNHYAYVIDHEHVGHFGDTTHVLAYDVVTQTTPRLVGQIAVDLYPIAMNVDGPYLGVVGFVGHAIDVTNPSAPRYLGGQIIWDGASGVDVSAGLIYAVAGTHGCLDVIDATQEPVTLESRLGNLGGCADIVIDEPYAYVMCRDTGLKVIDLSNPDVPRVERIARFAAKPRGLAVGGGLVAVTGDSGTEFFRANCPTQTLVVLSNFSATDTEFGVVLEWDADPSAFDGFTVFRATKEDVFDPLNLDDPVPGNGPLRYLDPNVVRGRTYSYKLAGQLDGGGTIVLGPLVVATTPGSLGLDAIQPNPSPGTVTLRFSLAQADRIRLSVFDVAGRRVRDVMDRTYPAGTHAVLWDGLDTRGHPAASGIYFVRFEHAGASAMRRLVLVR